MTFARRLPRESDAVVIADGAAVSAPITSMAPPPALAVLETATQVLFARLRAAGWQLDAEDEPRAIAFLALLLKLDPLAHPGLIAPILATDEATPFDKVSLVNAMAALGFRYLSVNCHAGDIDDRLLPAIFTTGSRTGLIYREGTQTVLLDGATVTHQPLSAWADQGDALLFSRMDDAQRPTSRAALESSGRTWFLEILRRFLPQVKYMLALSVLLNVLALAVPLFILLIYDRVLNTSSATPLIYLAKGVLIVLVAEYALRRARARILSHVMARLDYIVGTMSFEKLVNLPASLLDKADISDQIARIKTFESIRDFLCGPLMSTALELPIVLLSVALMLLIGGPLVSVSLLMMLIYTGVIFQARRGIAILIRRAAIESSQMQKFALDCFSKREAIQLDGLTAKWTELYRDVSGREQMAQLRLGLATARAEILGQLLAGLSALALLYVGAHLVWSDRLPAAALIACLVLHMRALAPFQALVGMVPRLEQMRNAVRQVNDLMSYDEEDTDARTLTTTRLDGAVRFSNVAIRYTPRAPLVFNGFTLDIRPGEVIGVTGANGSGKTTLLKMVLGLVEPQAGGIRLSGFDIRQLGPLDLRAQIAYVPQKVDFFSGTIAENLRFGMPLATEANLRDALAQVGALDAIMAMPAGLNSTLAMAQLQTTDPMLADRLALARAILRPARILLIDERPANLLRSGLDETLRDCIGALKASRTIMFVTHRTDLLRLADRVVALRGDGRAEIGTLDTILRSQKT